MGIREKLRRLDGGENKPPQPVAVQEDWLENVQSELNVRILREDKSLLLLKEETFALHQIPAYQALRDEGFRLPGLDRLLPELRNQESTLSDIIFFDTETTGLAGGTGTYAFLIGLGHVELDHVVVRQYLLPDFLFEWLQLKHVNTAMSRFRYSASFNGKSFDLPLLRSRFRLNRMDAGLDDLLHLDLLHASRRLWKSRLPGCSLQSLERHILGIDRIGDIPGSIIPQIYYEFIRKRDAMYLGDVLEHNFHDVVNMVLLTIRMAAICQRPEEMLAHDEDRLALAEYDLRQGRPEAAEPLLHGLYNANTQQPSQIEVRAAFLLANCYKKSGRAEAARNILQQLVQQQVQAPAIIEALAKHYEHADKDFYAALDVVEAGIGYLELRRALGTDRVVEKSLKAFKHRRTRLRGKIVRNEKLSK